MNFLHFPARQYVSRYERQNVSLQSKIASQRDLQLFFKVCASVRQS